MTTILLVRHGHVEGIDPLRFRGLRPLPLTERGYEQAELTARCIASMWRPSVVCTSPLERCVVTGARTAGLFGLEPVVSEGLRDLDYGEWQWKTHEEVRARWPRLYRLWRTSPHLVRFPGGDSLQDIVLRSADVFRQMADAFPDNTVVLVGHDSVNRALLLQLLDQPLSAYWRLAQDPCCINVIEFKKEVVRVVSVNDTSHLR